MTDIIEGFEALPGYFRELSQAFDEVDLLPYLEGEFEQLATLERGYWESDTDPNGVAWPPLAASTVKRKGHDTILVDRLRLRPSLTTKEGTGDSIREREQIETSAGLTFGTSLEYSPYHDVATEHRPARPHVGITEAYEDGAAERLVDDVLEQWATADV